MAKIGVLDQKITDSYSIYQGDSCEIIKGIPSDSIHYSIFSPPFASLFTFSNSERDMGNSKDDNSFYTHFQYLIQELYRVTMPGRLLSFHCMNLLMTINRDGVIGLKDFRGELIRMFVACGFIHHSEVVIWKDPLVQATRTKNLTLAHKQISKDATRCAQGFPDYIITMRKPGINPEPVAKGAGFDRYIGADTEPQNEKQNDPRINKYSHHVWKRYASPVWMDIRQTDTLNASVARDKDDEKHISLLQLQVIARCVELWTNPNDIVLSPFMGIGSEGYVSLKMGRRFVGIELKKSYYSQAIKNLQVSQNATIGFDL